MRPANRGETVGRSVIGGMLGASNGSLGLAGECFQAVDPDALGCVDAGGVGGHDGHAAQVAATAEEQIGVDGVRGQKVREGVAGGLTEAHGQGDSELGGDPLQFCRRESETTLLSARLTLRKVSRTRSSCVTAAAAEGTEVSAAAGVERSPLAPRWRTGELIALDIALSR